MSHLLSPHPDHRAVLLCAPLHSLHRHGSNSIIIKCRGRRSTAEHHNLALNTSMTMSHKSHLYKREGERIASFNISKDLFRTLNTSTLVRKPHQCLILWRMKKGHPSLQTLVNFYCTIQSLLTNCITVVRPAESTAVR